MSLWRQGTHLYVRWQIRIKQSQLAFGGEFSLRHFSKTKAKTGG